MAAASADWHFFEFMDLAWLPASVRAVLRDILECGNGRPFRGYYGWAVDEILRYAAAHGLTTIVELGAGTAPLSRRLAADARSAGLTLIVCDLNPDIPLYEELEQTFPGRVRTCREPIDFSQPQAWTADALLVLSATLHHVPRSERPDVLKALASGGNHVLIFEPLRRTLLSGLLCLLSVVPAMLVPAFQLHRPGRWRRVAWCWLLPIAAPLFVWDGLVSCWRQWSTSDWQSVLRTLSRSDASVGTVHETCFCQCVAIPPMAAPNPAQT